MPVKRITESFESMPNQWYNQNDIDLNQIETKTNISSAIEANSSEDNESYNGYKSALNDSVVDDLVSTLTNKLCLKSTHRLCRMSRLSPYQMHNTSNCRSQPNTGCYCLNCKYLLNSNTNNSSNGSTKASLKRSSSMSDTYELMQQLLKEGSLIKEAVKRLQIDTQQPMAKKSAIDFYEQCSSDDDFSQNENQINLLNS